MEIQSLLYSWEKGSKEELIGYAFFTNLMCAIIKEPLIFKIDFIKKEEGLEVPGFTAVKRIIEKTIEENKSPAINIFYIVSVMYGGKEKIKENLALTDLWTYTPFGCVVNFHNFSKVDSDFIKYFYNMYKDIDFSRFGVIEVNESRYLLVRDNIEEIDEELEKILREGSRFPETAFVELIDDEYVFSWDGCCKCAYIAARNKHRCNNLEKLRIFLKKTWQR